MDRLRIFIIIFIEVANFMLLWNLFNKGLERKFLKSMAIVLLTSIIVVLTNYFYASIEFVINYFFLFFLIKVIFKKSLKHLLLEFSLVLPFFGIVQLVTIILLRAADPIFMVQDTFIHDLIANLICIIISCFIYKYVDYKKILVFYRQEGSKIYFLSVNLLVYVLIAKWAWNFKRQMFLEEIVVFIIVPAVFIFGNMIFLTYHVRSSEMKKSLEEYNKYSSLISELFDNVRRRQHDFKNHLNTIYGLIQISDEKSLKETVLHYMDSVNSSLESIDKMIQIDNKVVMAIIYNKVNEADKSEIKFRYNIRGECIDFPFKDHELSEVLNNLLDNAFEAVLNSEKELKKVFLNMGYLEDGCIMEVGNTGRRIEFNEISRIFEAGYTTKLEEGHGYGLYNVKKIVESYGGRIQLSFEDNYTIFKIMLP